MRRFHQKVAGLLAARRLEERGYADPADLSTIDRKIGKVIAEELDSERFASIADMARCLGVTEELAERLAEGRSVTWEHTGVVQLDNEVAASYVIEQGARVVRSISAFGESDTVLRAGLDPRVFSAYGGLYPPNMLWQLDTGEWLAVSTTNVGYGGEGPHLARRALVAAGVSKEAADEIAAYRFCDAVDVTDPETWELSRMWPVEGRTWPQLVGDSMVIPFGPRRPGKRWREAPQLAHQRDPDPSGFYPSSHATPGWEQWVDFLDQDELPVWARGRRRAWLFLDREIAAERGFEIEVFNNFHDRGSPTLVIEQGAIQLWAFCPSPDVPGRLAHDSCFEYLRRAAFDTGELERTDVRRGSRWARFLRFIFPNMPQPRMESLAGRQH